MRRLVRPVLIGVLAAGVLYALSRPRRPEVTTLAGQTMGTYYRVKAVQVPADLSDKQLRLRIEARLHAFSESLSTWWDDSEISTFNASESGEWFEVSKDFVSVMRSARVVYDASEGAFDPTVGPLVDVWGFGTETQIELPSDSEVAAAMDRLGFDEIEVRDEPASLRKARPEIRLDVSAVAKGAGVDRIADLLDEAGVESYLVEIGGELRTRGTGPNGKPWTVGVSVPVPGVTTQMERVLNVSDAAIATSGDYRRFRTGPDGKRYSHAIDPRTGRPVTHTLASVTVIAETCVMADAWATALLVLGEEEGFRVAKENNLAALFLYRGEDGETILAKETPAFRSRFGTATP